MVEAKTIGISILIISGMISAGLIGANFFEKTPYYCESRSDIGIKYCDSLSKYGVDNGKCTINGVGIICKTGWVKIVDDKPLNIVQEQPINDDAPLQYKCNQVECIKV